MADAKSAPLDVPDGEPLDYYVVELTDGTVVARTPAELAELTAGDFTILERSAPAPPAPRKE